MLEFVDSGLYFVQDENNFINPLLQVGSGSDEKSTGSGGPKINGSYRIRILIPGFCSCIPENILDNCHLFFLILGNEIPRILVTKKLWSTLTWIVFLTGTILYSFSFSERILENSEKIIISRCINKVEIRVI